MSVSEKTLQAHVQTTLNLYSDTFPQIMTGYEKMNIRKGDYIIHLRDLPNMTLQEKENLFKQALLDYDAFIKTADLAKDLFNSLKKCTEECKKPKIDPHVYTKITELNIEGKVVIDAETIQTRESALETIAAHLEKKTHRFETVHKAIVDQRLGEVKVTLNQLVRGLRPNDVGYFSLNPYTTAEIEAARQSWLENPSNESAVNSTSAAPEKNTELNNALFTLGITHTDPETKHSYGSGLCQELTKSEGKEEAKENSSENELSAQALKRETDSFSTEEASSKDGVSIQAKENDLSSSSEDISVPFEQVFDPGKYEATASENEEASSAPVEKKLETAVLGGLNSQQPSIAAALEKKTPPSSPKVNAQEDAFDVLELATTKAEKEIAKESSSAPIEKPLAAESSSKSAAQEDRKPSFLEKVKATPISQSNAPAQSQKKKGKKK